MMPAGVAEKSCNAPSATRWNETELRDLLASELAAFLGVRGADVSPDKRFEDYGLDSIDAVIATEWIGRRLGIELPPEFLFYNPTLDAVVQAVLDGKYTDAHPATRHDNKAPVFLFPGGGGADEPALIQLRARSAPTLAFEVVRIGEWREWIKYNADFDSLADRARQHIEDTWPEGPIRLAGYSQGGQLAYATAVALARANRPVEIVALLDSGTEPPAELAHTKHGMIVALLSLAGRFVTARIRGTHIFPAGNKAVHFASWLWGVRHGPELLMMAARFGNALSRGRASIRGDHFIQMRIFSKMWNDWRAQSKSSISLDTKLVLFRSEDPGLADLGWSAFSSNLRVIPVSGDHYTMLESEHLDELIRRLIAGMDHAASSTVAVF